MSLFNIIHFYSFFLWFGFFKSGMQQENNFNSVADMPEKKALLLGCINTSAWIVGNILTVFKSLFPFPNMHTHMLTICFSPQHNMPFWRISSHSDLLALHQALEFEYL